MCQNHLDGYYILESLLFVKLDTNVKFLCLLPPLSFTNKSPFTPSRVHNLPIYVQVLRTESKFITGAHGFVQTYETCCHIGEIWCNISLHKNLIAIFWIFARCSNDVKVVAQSLVFNSCIQCSKWSKLSCWDTWVGEKILRMTQCRLHLKNQNKKWVYAPSYSGFQMMSHSKGTHFVSPAIGANDAMICCAILLQVMSF